MTYPTTGYWPTNERKTCKECGDDIQHPGWLVCDACHQFERETCDEANWVASAPDPELAGQFLAEVTNWAGRTSIQLSGGEYNPQFVAECERKYGEPADGETGFQTRASLGI